MVTTTNELGETVFKYGTTLSGILLYALDKGVDEAEKVIKSTYVKKESDYIIRILNSMK